MTTSSNQSWLPVVIIAGALIGWMVTLAVGAYWAPVGDSSGGDPRKLMVIAGTTGLFLLLWGGVLLRFTSRRRKQAEDAAESAESAENAGDS